MEPPHTQGEPLSDSRCPSRASLGRENRAGLLARFRWRATMSENHGVTGSIPVLGTD
jgi:hypothetical protein